MSFVFRDENLKPGTTYRYRVEVMDEEGRRVLFETEAISTPAAELSLYQNHPNPFNPSTTIQFVLPENGHANLSIFDARGKLVVSLVDQVLSQGLREFKWDGKDARGNTMSSGVYFYRLKAGNSVLTRKMVLIK
jgi:flagellar hook assembly protein FlgD